MAGADLRAFVYRLEPLRRQRQWQLDAALARLGEQRRRIAAWHIERDRLHQECVGQAAHAAQAWRDRADPRAQPRLLGYLAALHGRRAYAEREIAALGELAERARAACELQQQKLEVLEQHRTGELKVFATEQLRKSGVEADRDWGGRESYRHFGTEPA